MTLAVSAGEGKELKARFSLKGALSSAWNATKNFVGKAVDVVVDAGKAIGNAVGNFVEKAAEFVINTAKSVVKAATAIATNAIKLVTFAVTGKYENSLTLPVNLGPPEKYEVESPWGKAFKMYTFKMGEDNEKFSATQTLLDNMVEELIGEAEPEPGVEIYCVNCGVRGSVKATGKINATPLSGIKEAQIGVSGNMYIGLYIGVNAFAKWYVTSVLFIPLSAAFEQALLAPETPRLLPKSYQITRLGDN
jgi:hypothetical protein